MASKPDKFLPSLIGGVTIGILSAVPGLNLINCFCCVGVVLGGFLAVFFYKKNLGETELSYSDGALLGILSGIIGVIIGSVISVLIGTGMEQVMENILNYSDELPPEARDIITKINESRGQFFFLNIAFGLVIDILFGLLGGILGVAILGKKK